MATLTLKQRQMVIWVGNLEKNFQRFKDQKVTDPVEKLKFIQEQYVIFNSGHRVLEGKAQFSGANGEITL